MCAVNRPQNINVDDTVNLELTVGRKNQRIRRATQDFDHPLLAGRLRRLLSNGVVRVDEGGVAVGCFGVGLRLGVLVIGVEKI